MRTKQAEMPKEEKVEVKVKTKPFFDLWTIILVVIIVVLIFAIFTTLKF
jgi:uncharacterized integral membrane protein